MNVFSSVTLMIVTNHRLLFRWPDFQLNIFYKYYLGFTFVGLDHANDTYFLFGQGFWLDLEVLTVITENNGTEILIWIGPVKVQISGSAP